MEYQAPNPYDVQDSISPSYFLSIPPLELITQAIGRLVIPAQSRLLQDISPRRRLQLADQHELQIDIGLRVFTHDEAVLDTVEMTPISQRTIAMTDRRFIIKFNGNGEQYLDRIEQYALDADTLQMTVIGFDCRGVGKSKKIPNVFQDLVTDGIAQVQRLLDNGANPKHILLDGYSLGGAVATMVAQHFHKKGLPVYLWNDRSFATVGKAATGLFSPKELPAVFANPIEFSIGLAISNVMQFNGWDENIAAAYSSIPEHYKGYMVIAKKSEKLEKPAERQSDGDGMISHQASLHKAIKAEEIERKNRTMYKVLARNTFLNKGGHNYLRRELISKDKPEKSGQDLFESFASRLNIPDTPDTQEEPKRMHI